MLIARENTEKFGAAIFIKWRSVIIQEPVCVCGGEGEGEGDCCSAFVHSIIEIWIKTLRNTPRIQRLL